MGIMFLIGFCCQVEGIFETQQKIGLEWRDPRLQVLNPLKKASETHVAPRIVVVGKIDHC